MIDEISISYCKRSTPNSNLVWTWMIQQQILIYCKPDYCFTVNYTELLQSKTGLYDEYSMGGAFDAPMQYMPYMWDLAYHTTTGIMPSTAFS